MIAAMEKLDLTFFYTLGQHLKALADTDPDADRFSIALPVLRLQPNLQALLESYPLTVCRSEGDALLQGMANWVASWPDDMREEMEPRERFQVGTIVNKAKSFEPILLAEIQTLAAYHVTQKGIYSTPDLIERADNTLPESVLKKMPSRVTAEMRMGGRCLAFDNSTASAFHMMRAIELVMHEYYVRVCKPKSKKKLDNWGAYVAQLSSIGDPDVQKVVAILQQIKDQDRNLIMHPEVVLSAEEAFTLFEVGQGAIIAMASRLKEPTKKKGKAN